MLAFQQIEDVGADLRGIAIPFVDPVAVDLPVWAGKRLALGRAPIMNRQVCFTEFSVGTKVRHGGRVARRQGGADDLVLSRKRSLQFDPHLGVDETVSGVAVQGHVPPSVVYLRGLYGFPNQATSLRNEPR